MTTRRWMYRALAGCLTALAFACRSSSTDQDGAERNDVVCTADFRYGLNVTVLDATTGAAVPRPILIIATEGTYADTSQIALSTGSAPAFAAWPLLGERAGKYSVRVRATGYQEWRQDDVVITRDVCHVIPVALTARLVRSP